METNATKSSPACQHCFGDHDGCTPLEPRCSAGKMDFAAAVETKQLTDHQNRALDVYGIAYAGRRDYVKARRIRNALLELGTDRALAAVASIDHLCSHGERYSNQSFDVLSCADSVLPSGWLEVRS